MKSPYPMSNIRLVKLLQEQIASHKNNITISYYKDRNYLFFQKKQVTNKLIFWINFKIYYLFKPKKRKALIDGYK